MRVAPGRVGGDGDGRLDRRAGLAGHVVADLVLAGRRFVTADLGRRDRWPTDDEQPGPA
jgi:hypothetical protein